MYVNMYINNCVNMYVYVANIHEEWLYLMNFNFSEWIWVSLSNLCSLYLLHIPGYLLLFPHPALDADPDLVDEEPEEGEEDADEDEE